MADESPYPIVEIDRNGNILYVNPAMVEVLCLFGYDLRQQTGQFFGQPSPLVATCLFEGRTLRSQDVVRGEVLLQLDTRPVPSNHLVRAYGIDLTEVYATHRVGTPQPIIFEIGNRQLDQALQQAQSAALAKSSFMAMITHELRTPMNGVIGMASLLLDTPLTEEQRSFQTINNVGEAQLSLINDASNAAKSKRANWNSESPRLSPAYHGRRRLVSIRERAQRKGSRSPVWCMRPSQRPSIQAACDGC